MLTSRLCHGAFYLLVGAALVGCNAEQESISQVTKPRLLALAAEPPEIAAGGTSTLQLLLVDENGPITEAAEVAWIVLAGDFAAVPDPEALGSDITAAVLELRPPVGVDSGGGTLTVTAGPEVLEGAEDGQDATLTAFVMVCAGGVLPSTTEALLERLLALFSGKLKDYNDLCDGPGTGIAALKQLAVSRLGKPANDVNHNPILYSLVMDEQELSPDLGEKVQAEHECEGTDGCREDVLLSAHLAVDSFETYLDSFGEERLDEVAYVSWFVTGGKFDVDRSGVSAPPSADDESWGPFEVRWFPPREGGEVDLWCVAHDVRGGVSWWRTRLRALAKGDF
ncbi:MAG: hypothetical protein MUC50_03055 [Myxococcota bacterium]|jgi:hypothetical protein|nr:hypothetical protein [Myxococcota bacterium]